MPVLRVNLLPRLARLDFPFPTRDRLLEISHDRLSRPESELGRTYSNWYCLLSDGSDLKLNVRVMVPMPYEFPKSQLMSPLVSRPMVPRMATTSYRAWHMERSASMSTVRKKMNPNRQAQLSYQQTTPRSSANYLKKTVSGRRSPIN